MKLNIFRYISYIHSLSHITNSMIIYNAYIYLACVNQSINRSINKSINQSDISIIIIMFCKHCNKQYSILEFCLSLCEKNQTNNSLSCTQCPESYKKKHFQVTFFPFSKITYLFIIESVLPLHSFHHFQHFPKSAFFPLGITVDLGKHMKIYQHFAL